MVYKNEISQLNDLVNLKNEAFKQKFKDQTRNLFASTLGFSLQKTKINFSTVENKLARLERSVEQLKQYQKPVHAEHTVNNNYRQ